MVEIPKPKQSSMNFIWIVDASDSMRYDGKMNAVNSALKEAIPHIRELSKQREFKIFMRALKFSTGAEWMQVDNIPVEEYEWTDIQTDKGVTDLGEALTLLAEAMKFRSEGGKMPERAKKPHLVLITDGYPTDDWETGLNNLMNQEWGRLANRMAIGLPGADREVLEKFIGDVEDKEKKLVEVTNVEKLAENIIILSDMAGQQVPGENYGVGGRQKNQNAENASPPPSPEPQQAPVAPPATDEKKEDPKMIPEEVEF
jgi:uncharacterized protein YegL